MVMGSGAAEPPRSAGLLGAYSALTGRLCRLAYALAAMLVLMDMVLVGGSVVLRYFFSSGVRGADEIVAFSLTAIVMLSAPEVLRRHQHIAVDIVVALLPSNWKRWAQLWAAISVLAVALLLIVNGSNTVAFSRMIGSLTDGQLEWPVWMLQLFLPTGGVLLGMVALEHIWRSILAMRSGDPHDLLQDKESTEPSPADSL